jgi:DNA polymerase III, delta subunit|nr:MAG: DNA polymerase III subunit delta [Pseudomonadota bacterium]
MKLTLDSLSAHLERQLLPAYLVSGDEPLLTGEAADAIRARARAAGYTDREVHFMERGADWNEVRASFDTLSLFASRRIVEIRLPSGKPGAAGGATLVELIEGRRDDVLLLILTGRLDREAQSADWVRAVEAHGAWLPVWPVEPERLVAWLRARCRRQGLELTDEALELLAERTEGNLLAAHQEIEKLRLLLTTPRAGAEEVLASVADSARFDVFQLGDALVAGDAARAIRVLAGLRAEGVEPVLVLWAVVKALRDLWSAASGAAPPPGRGRFPSRQNAALEQARRRAARLDFDRLTARACLADRIIKGRATGDAWDEMALLAAELCARPALPLPRGVLK